MLQGKEKLLDLVSGKTLRAKIYPGPNSSLVPVIIETADTDINQEILDAGFAERINALLGTHPVFKQSPPILCFSINATFARTVAAI